MRTVEEIKKEISKVEKARKNAERKIRKCTYKLAELKSELLREEKGIKKGETWKNRTK